MPLRTAASLLTTLCGLLLRPEHLQALKEEKEEEEEERGEEVDSDCLKRHLREERKEKGAGQAGGAHHGLKGDYSGGLRQRQQGNHR